MKIIEGMGFSEEETKHMLLKCPLVFKHKFEDRLQANFELLHMEVRSSVSLPTVTMAK